MKSTLQTQARRRATGDGGVHAIASPAVPPAVVKSALKAAARSFPRVLARMRSRMRIAPGSTALLPAAGSSHRRRSRRIHGTTRRLADQFRAGIRFEFSEAGYTPTVRQGAERSLAARQPRSTRRSPDKAGKAAPQVNLEVQHSDGDRSKIIRHALREKLTRAGIPIKEAA